MPISLSVFVSFFGVDENLKEAQLTIYFGACLHLCLFLTFLSTVIKTTLCLPRKIKAIVLFFSTKISFRRRAWCFVFFFQTTRHPLSCLSAGFSWRSSGQRLCRRDPTPSGVDGISKGGAHHTNPRWSHHEVRQYKYKYVQHCYKVYAHKKKPSEAIGSVPASLDVISFDFRIETERERNCLASPWFESQPSAAILPAIYYLIVPATKMKKPHSLLFIRSFLRV